MPGIAGLDADTAVVAPEQLIVSRERPARAGDGFGRDDRAKLFVLQGRLRKTGQIKRGGIVFAAVQTMRVAKVRLRQAQRTGAQIHLPDKRRLGAGDGNSQRQGRVVAGMEHHAVKKIAPRQRLALFQIYAGAFQSDGSIRHGHGSVQFSCFTDKKTGPDFCRAGDQRTLVAVFCVKALPCRPVEQRGAFGRHLRGRRELRGA